MKKSLKKSLEMMNRQRAALAVGATTVAGSAMADAGGGIDPTAIVAGIVALGVTIALVGNARLLMDLGVRSFRWLRGALS